MTAGALATHPEVRQVDCVELSRAVLGGAPWFAEANNGFLSDPRARIHLEDAVITSC